ncbi:MAG: hypothetical protein IT365_25840, partial [Candidatus Hydrogenedentes bacterium]|nr:hypothetical protein [Candidatus Hydrogenedentota bacterium]
MRLGSEWAQDLLSSGMKLLVARQLNRVSVLVAALGSFLFCAAVFAQPELKVQSDPQPARIGEPYRVSCEVSWTGEAGDFVILPAEVAKPDWANVKLSPVKAFVRDGNNIVLQTIVFEPTQEGEVEVPAILIPYLRPEDINSTEKPETPTHLNAPDAPPKLRADPFP